ncbi:unnamed protein product [Clonostachys rosea]|uniref:C2H2-type domain-containing protein n=1 Tax=Bionectria ochroleuca TaxID=29856 RepID=A0ABY6UV14_BIOOC|nr:unnamed protein product [Clonostachys rosea]
MSARWPESEEDLLFMSRERGVDWQVISSRLPGRSESHCRNYYDYWADRRAIEDKFIVRLRGRGVGWDEIAEQIPERSSFSCSEYYKHYQNLQVAERTKNEFSEVYHRMKEDMWKQIGDELGVGWRAAEAMHWQLGEQELERRANRAARLREEEHEKHPCQARDTEQHEAGESDNSSQSQEFYEWDIPPLAHSIMVLNRRYYCRVPKCKGSTCTWEHCTGEKCPAELCDRSFPSEGSCRKHLRAHFKPVQCPFCERRASSQSEMRRHITTHKNKQDGKHSHFCPFCKKGLTRKDNLQRHIRMKHGLTDSSTPYM